MEKNEMIFALQVLSRRGELAVSLSEMIDNGKEQEARAKASKWLGEEIPDWAWDYFKRDVGHYVDRRNRG